MRFKTIKNLVKLVEESDIKRLSVSTRISGFEIVGRQGIKFPEQMENLNPVFIEKKPKLENYYFVESSFVGLFYWDKPEAGKPVMEGRSLVRKKTRYDKGQILGYIYCLKQYNEVKIDKPGIIRKVRVKNGHPVEYGTKLFEIELCEKP
ncbi:MAG: biotin/lipoyl-containing protein [Nanoarchaeota archaeon]